MAGSVTILLVYEVPGGRSLTVARVADRSLVAHAASLAISVAEARAEELGDADRTLGMVEREEAHRLKRVLSLLVPEISHPAMASGLAN